MYLPWHEPDRVLDWMGFESRVDDDSTWIENIGLGVTGIADAVFELAVLTESVVGGILLEDTEREDSVLEVIVLAESVLEIIVLAESVLGGIVLEDTEREDSVLEVSVLEDTEREDSAAEVSMLEDTAIRSSELGDAELEGVFDGMALGDSVLDATTLVATALATTALVATALDPHCTLCTAPIVCPWICLQTVSSALPAPGSSFAAVSSTPATLCGPEIWPPSPTIPL